MIREPWRDLRKRLEDIFEDPRLPRVGLVPVTDDVARLYELWVGMGGDGIVLKEWGSMYQPGIRTTAWLKVKPKLTLDVVVAVGSSEPIRWGDWALTRACRVGSRTAQIGESGAYRPWFRLVLVVLPVSAISVHVIGVSGVMKVTHRCEARNLSIRTRQWVPEFTVVPAPSFWCARIEELRGHAPISASACSSQNRMSISRYIVVADVRCS